MDLTPRNQFNCRLAQRYWDIPLDIPRATHYNVPMGTHYCDQLGYLCHPQDYSTFHGSYRNIPVESELLLNLDYYNPFDIPCDYQQKLSPALIKAQYSGINRCQTTPKLWNNHSKLHKFNTPF